MSTWSLSVKVLTVRYLVDIQEFPHPVIWRKLMAALFFKTLS